MKVKPRPPEAGPMKVGQALESRLQVLSHMDRLHMPGLGADWLREGAWLFPAFLRHSHHPLNPMGGDCGSTLFNDPINNGSLNPPDPQVTVLIEVSLYRLISATPTFVLLQRPPTELPRLLKVN